MPALLLSGRGAANVTVATGAVASRTVLLILRHRLAYRKDSLGTAQLALILEVSEPARFAAATVVLLAGRGAVARIVGRQWPACHGLTPPAIWARSAIVTKGVSIG